MFPLLALQIVLGGPAVAQTATEADTQPAEALRRAQVLYWVGVEQQGLLESFDRALEELDRAEAALATANLEPAERRGLNLQVRTLREELDNQYARVRPSFYGVFPLARLIVPTLLMDARLAGAYELVDPPARVAVGMAAKESLIDILRFQHPHVVVNSRPPNRELEAEAIAVFALGTRPWVHSRTEVLALLTEAQLELFDRGTITAEIKDRLLSSFDATQLLVLDILEEAVLAGDHLYVLQGRFYARDSLGTVDSFARRGIARDRRDQLVPLLLTNAGLLLLSIVLYPAFARLHGRFSRTLGALAMSGGAAFVVGRLLAWVAIPFLDAIEPAPTAPAILSWWWPALIGLVLVALPGILGWLLAMRIKRLFGLKGERAVGAIFGVSTLGMCAYFAGPLLILQGAAGFQSLVPLTLAASGLANILGGALRTGPPVAPFFMTGPLLFSPLLGMALLHGRPGPLWGVAAASIVLAIVVALHNLHTRKHRPRGHEDQDEDAAYREDEQKMRVVEEELAKKLPI